MMKFRNTRNNDNVGNIIEDNRLALTDDDLDQVYGGGLKDYLEMLMDQVKQEINTIHPTSL